LQNQTDIDWAHLGITKQFVSAVQDIGFSNPTEVQAKCIPIFLGGQNLIGIAQTGTGKTGAYLIPILFKLKFFTDAGPRALVLLPTKELVAQVAQQAQLFAKNTDIRIAALYGGVGPKGQLELLDKGCDVIVSTPGRFEELYLKGAIKVKTIKMLVIDDGYELHAPIEEDFGMDTTQKTKSFVLGHFS
jgi:ATP-dependent RNA helicase RhlE